MDIQRSISSPNKYSPAMTFPRSSFGSLTGSGGVGIARDRPIESLADSYLAVRPSFAQFILESFRFDGGSEAALPDLVFEFQVHFPIPSKYRFG